MGSSSACLQCCPAQLVHQHRGQGSPTTQGHWETSHLPEKWDDAHGGWMCWWAHGLVGRLWCQLCNREGQRALILQGPRGHPNPSWVVRGRKPSWDSCEGSCNNDGPERRMRCGEDEQNSLLVMGFTRGPAGNCPQVQKPKRQKPE